MRLVRYADDVVVVVAGTRDDADVLWDEAGAVLAPTVLRLAVEKTRVVDHQHVDDGFDFLGWHIQRRSWRGRPGKKVVYTYPQKKVLASIVDKVRHLTRRAPHALQTRHALPGGASTESVLLVPALRGPRGLACRAQELAGTYRRSPGVPLAGTPRNLAMLMGEVGG